MMLHKAKHKKRKVSRTLSTFTISSGGNPHSASKMLHSKSTYFYRWCVPSLCASALLFGGIVSFNPVMSQGEVFAVDEETTGNNDGIAPIADPVINLTITPDGGNTNGNVTAGEVAYFSNTVAISGAGINKYYLTLSSPSGSTGKLVGVANSSATVDKVGKSTTPTNFGENTWGYAVSTNINATSNTLAYNPVPSGGSTVYLATRTSAPASGGDNYKLVFAAKLGTNMPADHYQANVYVSAVANVDAVTNLGLANIVGDIITRMQDMTPSFCMDVTEGTVGRLADARDGKVYHVTKLKDGNCWMTQNIAYNGGGTLRCTVDGTTCTDWPSSGTPKYYAIGSHTNASPASIGNYYTWLAAVNGNGNVLEPKQGICPDGWQLPFGNFNTDSKSFKKLLTTYGIDDSASGSSTLRSSPLNFIYGGVLDSGQLVGGGADPTIGRYWSSTSGQTGYAYGMSFSSNSASLSGQSKAHYGMSVRCVAR